MKEGFRALTCQSRIGVPKLDPVELESCTPVSIGQAPVVAGQLQAMLARSKPQNGTTPLGRVFKV